MTIRRKLIDGAAIFDVDLDERQADACLVYLVELEKWNRRINLTAIRNEQDIIVKHFLDSFSLVRGFTPFPGATLMDLGSGAGFPALPLKIAFPYLQVTLIEAVQKKAVFLRHIIRTLQLVGSEVIGKRTEVLPQSYRTAYDVLTARAFASMERTIQIGAAFLRSKGVMVLSRGPEEPLIEKVVMENGLEIEKRLELSLPFSGDKRAIWVFRRI